jgi:uncharacterized protein YegL
MKTQPLGKKALSLLLTLLMLFSLVPPILAAPGDPKNQIDFGAYPATTVYYDEEGHLLASPGQYDYAVALTKSITDTVGGIRLPENEFQITLDVNTTVDVSEIEISPDCGVVILLDVSNSMIEVIGSGQIDHIASLKRAAIDFVNSYGGDATPGSKRLVSVVEFGTNAKTLTNANTSWNNWFDTATPTGRAGAITAINSAQNQFSLSPFASSYDTGGTNMSGGLLLARNLLNALKNNPASIYRDVSNLYVILFTDGEPTYRYAPGTQNNWTSTDFIPMGAGNGNSTTVDDIAAVVAQATDINTLGAEMFTIAYRLPAIPNLLRVKPIGIATWSYAASDAASLIDAFDAIGQIIEKFTQAWTVTDPMAQYITWKPDNLLDFTQSYTASDRTFHWNIKQSGPIVTEPIVGKKIYSYRFAYRVILDNYDGYSASNIINTNNNLITIANLMYCTEISTQPIIPGQEIFFNAYFNTPRIHGYSGGFNFSKIAEGGPFDGQTLAGCAFALLSTERDGSGTPIWSAAGLSAGNGAVSFGNIPSGHTYTLREASLAPAYAADYLLSNKIYNVAVMYGDVVITDPSKAPGSPGYIVYDSTSISNNFQFINYSRYIDIIGTKTWTGDFNNAYGTRPDSITLQLLRGGAPVGTATAYAPNYTYSFTNIPRADASGNMYTYKVNELAVSGYTPTYAGDYDQEITNAMTSDALINFTVSKNWLDNQDQYGTRPESVRVQLYKNTMPEGSPVTLSTPLYTYTFTNLPRYDGAGTANTYWVQELTVNGYTPAYTGTYNEVISNAMNNDAIVSIQVNKTWEDLNNVYGMRPSSVQVQLYRNDQPQGVPVTLSSPGYTYTFANLPRYDRSNNLYTYRVV